jgi:hypothetical protein
LLVKPRGLQARYNNFVVASPSPQDREQALTTHPKMPVTTRTMASIWIVDHIINICGFSEDSTMYEFIKQQGWTELSDIFTIS